MDIVDIDEVAAMSVVGEGDGVVENKDADAP